MLKLGVPTNDLQNEFNALRYFGDSSMVRLLDAQPDCGALLMERVSPGASLVKIDEPTATITFCKTVERLRNVQSPFITLPTTADWFARLSSFRNECQVGSPISSALLDQAINVSSELLRTTTPQVVLHGDLHHYNILQNQNGDGVAIDPKGVVGDPVYETCAWLRNPYPYFVRQAEAREITRNRLSVISERLGYDRQRVIAWAFCQCVLSAVWSIDDNEPDWEYDVAGAELFNQL